MALIKHPHFNTAVDAIFKNWSALQLAVSHGSGGPQSAAKAEWMIEVTENWFYENKELNPYEVTDFLEDIINQEFNLIINDGSSDEIGRLLCEYFVLCGSGSENVLAKIQTLPKCDLSKCKVENDDGDVEDMEGLDNEVSDQVEGMEIQNDVVEEPQESLTDPDGFTMVSSRKKKNK